MVEMKEQPKNVDAEISVIGCILVGGMSVYDKIKPWLRSDEVFYTEINKQIWQSFAVLPDIRSVGVMGDERTYEQVVALRAVESVDGMTADWVHLPYDLLAEVSNQIINRVSGINRVAYDISSKPPATIEWE